MQYSVPQFVDVEDKIIGPLTIKQFLFLVAGGLVLFMFWSIFGPGVIFFIIALPVVGIFALLAFGRFNGRPLLQNFPLFIHFVSRPRYRVFRRLAESTRAPQVKVKSAAPRAAVESQGEHVSRLKKLAYLLDQKSAEEERLIRSGQTKQKWLNQI